MDNHSKVSKSTQRDKQESDPQSEQLIFDDEESGTSANEDQSLESSSNKINENKKKCEEDADTYKNDKNAILVKLKSIEDSLTSINNSINSALIKSIEEKFAAIAKSNGEAFANLKKVIDRFDALKGQISDIKSAFDSYAKKSDIDEMFDGNENDYGLNDIAEILNGDIDSNLQGIKSQLEGVLTKTDAEGMFSENDLKAKLEDISDKISCISDEVNKITNLQNNSDGFFDLLSDQLDSVSSKIVEEVNKNTDNKINMLQNKLSSDVKLTISSTIKDYLSSKMKTNYLSKNIIMLVISALVLSVCTIFISCGFFVRYQFTAPLAMSWVALAFYCIAIFSMLFAIAFADKVYEYSTLWYIVLLSSASLILVVTFIMSLLSMILL